MLAPSYARVSLNTDATGSFALRPAVYHNLPADRAQIEFFSNGAWFKAIENAAVRCIWRSQFAQNLILQRPRHGQGDGKNLSHLSIRSCFLKGKKTNLDVVNLTVVCKKCCEISHCKGNPNRARLPRKSRCIHDKSCLGATFGAQGRIMQGGYPENESKCKNPKD